jgi:signal transduction histidine kinase
MFVFYFLRNPFVVGSVVPASLSLFILAVASWLWTRDADEQRIYRLGVWCATITIFATALGILNIYSEWMFGGQIQSGVVMIANSAVVGAVLGLLVGFYDSDRHRQRRHVEQQRAEIEALNERLTVLNRVLRHDIRNDVNLIDGYAKMIKENAHPTDDAVDMIRTKASEIVTLSQRARNVEELFNSDTTHGTVDLVALVRDELDEIRAGYPDEIVIRAEHPETAVVRGTPILQSALDNLLENAIEHTDTSPVELTIALTEVDGGYRVEITDNGPGLPEHERQLLVGGKESKLEHSDGMGLWIVSWIVGEFGGDIDIEQTDSGTQVAVWLPTPDDPAEPTSAAKHRRESVASP